MGNGVEENRITLKNLKVKCNLEYEAGAWGKPWLGNRHSKSLQNHWWPIHYILNVSFFYKNEYLKELTLKIKVFYYQKIPRDSVSENACWMLQCI